MSQQSLKAFDSFIKGLSNARKNKNNSVVFNATVEYTWPGRSEMEVLEVRAARGGVEHGNITIDEGKKLTSVLVHLDASLKYQNYEHKGLSLVITGKSPKLGGPYKIMITEQ